MSTSASSGSPAVPIASLSTEQKLLEAARRAGPKLPAGARHEFEQLFTPENLAITVGVLGLWAASHAFGVGFAVDVLILLLGVCALGWTAVQAAEKLRLFVTIAAQAKDEVDLERAAGELAGAVTLVGVTVFTALVLKRIGRTETRNRAANAARVVRRQRLVQALGAKGQNPNVRARIATALDFYERSFPSWNEERLASHLKGIDWSSPVEVVRLKKGTRLVGFKQVGEADLSGHYFARPGAAPRDLGISMEGEVYTKVLRGGFERVQGRRHVVYEVTCDIEVLESKTAAVRDTWSAQRTSSFPQTDAHRPAGRPGPLGDRPELVTGGQAQLVVPEPATMLREVPKP